MSVEKNLILSDKELENVIGGAGGKIKFMKVACTHCKKIIRINVDVSEAKCPFCKKINTFAG
ncbi:bacteriocin [Butyrivibrio sp. VCB2006]|uniref:bacteriocin n=1 Tax=Butyrivibrio sp. VCB2006 TaxID=1280679 RepID=UPI0003F755D5|nr:bacteriocin [Butyrivibrio sp. VCB2006]